MDGSAIIVRTRRGGRCTDGFDALAAMVVSMRNDGSPVTLMTDPPSPQPGDVDDYQRMTGRLEQSYETTFAGI